jgi:hypothetical protein
MARILAEVHKGNFLIIRDVLIVVRLLKEWIPVQMRKAYMLLIVLLFVVIIGIILISSPRTSAPLTHAQSGSTPAQKPILLKIPLRWANATPAFTLDDVRQALQTHSFRGGSTLTGNQPIAETVAFMTMKELAVYLSSQTGHAVTPGAYPTRLICYVQLRGPFLMVAQSVPPGEKIPTAARGFEVFDAHTGMLFEWGTLP